jgi:hypothetical protein
LCIKSILGMAIKFYGQDVKNNNNNNNKREPEAK